MVGGKEPSGSFPCLWPTKPAILRGLLNTHMKTVTAPHPLDDMFDVEPNQTQVLIPGGSDKTSTEGSGDIELYDDDQVVTIDTIPTPSESYDRIDKQIDDQIQEVYTKAVDAYEVQMVHAATVTDKRYAAENAKVAADFLSIALNAVAHKGTAKANKDKMRIAREKIEAQLKSKSGDGSGAQYIQNNIYTSDRNAALEAALSGNLKEISNGKD